MNRLLVPEQMEGEAQKYKKIIRRTLIVQETQQGGLRGKDRYISVVLSYRMVDEEGWYETVKQKTPTPHKSVGRGTHIAQLEPCEELKPIARRRQGKHAGMVNKEYLGVTDFVDSPREWGDVTRAG